MNIYLYKQYLYFSTISIFCVIVLGYIYTIYAFPSLGSDSGYFLKISYDLANGLSFYKDLNCSYTPLVMYFFSIPFYLNKSIGLEFIFTYFLTTYLLIAVVFYRLSFYFNSNRKINIFFTFLLITIIIKLEGIHILLEPYVLLFQLLAIYCLYKYQMKNKTLICVGFFVFLSFFSKQYGLFILPAVLYFIGQKVSNLKQFIIKCFFLSFGLFMPAIILMIYFYVFKNVNMVDFIYQFIGIPALVGDELMGNMNYVFINLLYKLRTIFIKTFPVILILVVFIHVILKNKWNHNNMVALLLFLGSILTLYFGYYTHYFQLIIPYSILLILSIPPKILKSYFLLLAVLMCFFFKRSYSELKSTYFYKKEIYASQKIMTNILKKYLNIGDEVYLEGISPVYYYLSKYNSTNYKNLGYKYPSELTHKRISKNMNKGSYIILRKNLITKNEFSTFTKIGDLESETGAKVFILKK
jgi:hypothetical protein